MLSIIFLAICLATNVFAGPGDADQIHSLPGLKFPINYKHYSGYLESIDGTRIFYWFFESKSKPATDPLLLWLNGGPGSSSLLGVLTEHGPLRLVGDHLEPNEYAWNEKASVVYFESPASVGFSYNINGTVTAGDKYTAEVNYAALVDFFRKFPQYRANDFYVTGESYGGIYVPTLARLVHRHQLVANFKGIAIGNGLHDWELMENTLYPFHNYHGMIDEPVYARLMNECCAGVNNVRNCDFRAQNSVNCQMAKTVSQAQFYFNVKLNRYNIYADCFHSTNKSSVLLANRMRLWSSRHNLKLSGLRSAQFYDDDTEEMEIPCIDNISIRRYLRRDDVKKALHVDPKSAPWNDSSMKVFLRHSRDYANTKEFHEELLAAGKRVLIYHGDIDAACNFLMGQWFVEELAKPMTKPFNAWLVDDQVAGMSKVFGPNQQLVFTTIRGSGHMVPTDKPKVALEMLRKFLNKSF